MEAAAQAGNSKFLKMTTKPVGKLVISLAVPSIMIMLISGLYNMADTYFVGSLGTSAVGAVGIAFPLMAVIQALGFFFGQGSGNYISRELGAQRVKNASKMAATGLFSGIIFMVFVSAGGLFFLSPLCRALGATDTILPYAEQYIFFILIGGPVMVGSLVINQQLRFQGSAFYAMIGMTSGAVINIFLDPLLIYGFDMGVRGAALATIISQSIAFVILLIGCRFKDNIRIHLKNFSPSLANYRDIFKGGIPALLRQSLMSIATIIINHFAGVWGDEAIAAISITNRVCMFAASAMLGFGQGFQPVCGFNYGAKRYDRVKKAFWFSVRLAAGALIVIAVALAVFAPQIIALFRRDDPEVIRIGTLSLRLQCISIPLSAWVVINNMMTQTIGKSFEASILAVSRQGLFLIPALFILTPLLGLMGLQFCMPVADILSFFLAIPISVKILREMK
ncbi:MAG: MATE family efflux transporter [Treponema sp.]|nr:MATE family efflux transporter [Treponema sp.]